VAAEDGLERLEASLSGALLIGSRLGRRIDDCRDAFLVRAANENRDSDPTGWLDGPFSAYGVLLGADGYTSSFCWRGGSNVFPGTSSVRSPGCNALPVFLRRTLFTVSTGSTANLLGFFSDVPFCAVPFVESPLDFARELLDDSSTGCGRNLRRGFSAVCSFSFFSFSAALDLVLVSTGSTANFRLGADSVFAVVLDVLPAIGNVDRQKAIWSRDV